MQANDKFMDKVIKDSQEIRDELAELKRQLTELNTALDTQAESQQEFLDLLANVEKAQEARLNYEVIQHEKYLFRH